MPSSEKSPVPLRLEPDAPQRRVLLEQGVAKLHGLPPGVAAGGVGQAQVVGEEPQAQKQLGTPGDPQPDPGGRPPDHVVHFGHRGPRLSAQKVLQLGGQQGEVALGGGAKEEHGEVLDGARTSPGQLGQPDLGQDKGPGEAFVGRPPRPRGEVEAGLGALGTGHQHDDKPGQPRPKPVEVGLRLVEVFAVRVAEDDEGQGFHGATILFDSGAAQGYT